MKRVGLRRVTPLRARSTLSSSTGLNRTAPINPTSSKRRAQQVARKAAERRLGRDSDGTGSCDYCGRSGLVVHGHELAPAGYGKDWSRPDALLCDLHNGLMEDYPTHAAWMGWKYSTKHMRDPELPAGTARRLDGSLYRFGGAA